LQKGQEKSGAKNLGGTDKFTTRKVPLITLEIGREEALPIIGQLIQQDFLALTILWKVNKRYSYSSEREIQRWIKYELLKKGSKISQEMASSIANDLIQLLAHSELIERINFVSRHGVIDRRVIPKVKSLKIISNKSDQFKVVQTFDDVSLCLTELEKSNENVTIIFNPREKDVKHPRVILAEGYQKTPQVLPLTFDIDKCDENCKSCLLCLHSMSYCLKKGEIFAEERGLTRKRQLETEPILTISEAFQVLEVLAWSRGLGIKILWNIASRDRESTFRNVQLWVRHHLRKATKQGAYCVCAKNQNEVFSLGVNLINALKMLGLVTTMTDKNRKRSSANMLHRQYSSVIIIPKIKSITIIFDRNSTEIETLLEEGEAFEWLRSLTTDYKPLTSEILNVSKKNVKVVLPNKIASQSVQFQTKGQFEENQQWIEQDNEDYKKSIAENALRLWKETKDLEYFEKIERRKEAIIELNKAIALYDNNIANCPFLHSKLAKWEGIVLSQEGKWERALQRFEEGLSLAKEYIIPEINWFEASIAETEAWINLKDDLVQGVSDPFSKVIPNLEKSKLLYDKSRDAPSRNFVDYWIRLFNSLKSGVLTDCSLYESVSKYIERDSPRAIRRKQIVDPLGTFSVLKPLLMYNELERVAQVLETGLNDILSKYFRQTKKLSLDTTIRDARALVKPSEKIEWLVRNNTTKKHLTSERLEKANHIQEVDRESKLLDGIETEISAYLTAIEEKIK
jgi:tetratricopeptide (TPR) repeat protein